ncbi:hypothetical protein SAMN05421810_104215 [Amycolatopsis arida]|uniref:Uncharacterized protein n=1 Tax=Amycolatopsis arida TaxID=587909 RepID=A0A1I5V318_9PSEU|nr:hypothetical protein [Amycolatopsis arida]TDX91132.1 hypothetical protein CLV69_106214 [Amycolatopsis arida]SFQ01954.1 hypothetical protein SAMN05421810_104215 [Amycolatopsis arida]
MDTDELTAEPWQVRALVAQGLSPAADLDPTDLLLMYRDRPVDDEGNTHRALLDTTELFAC